MKILMVSIFAPHFFNWTEQLKNSGHKVYWLDVFDSNTHVEQIDFVHQIKGWRYKYDFPGRYFLKENAPRLTKLINRFNERKLSSIFKKILLEIEPDVVHSFVMYASCVPILEEMQKHPNIKWIYSAWGNDLFFYQNEEKYLIGIKEVLPRINFMFADCQRDFQIAKIYGFEGKFLGVFPTGGGYNSKFFEKWKLPIQQRKKILIKGYQHKFGRSIKILEAVNLLKSHLSKYEIVVFAANQKVIDFAVNHHMDIWENFKIYEKLPHEQILKLMGSSRIYLGSSISDGMPNTLLEAIIMETFPIQSNPGGATAEIISHNFNGLLISDPEDSKEIANLILCGINNEPFLRKAIDWNSKNITPLLEREKVKNKVLEAYAIVEREL
ncbi:glycosyltransferase [Antarcticibacterium sp. 1MA-6-2]|uniref:glycosyltransferase n=1 Tax=Antarcticibacterium sp. 1MA-6-2 TaxID=2908210 RepID=UPI001F3A8273|nr:glycosyltransferase [Antarcticibacterium sp. 1MA-6-2]UJH92509.1 glycosyltransferase [Antarcticibacterium sp. 1MA-6-2]